MDLPIPLLLPLLLPLLYHYSTTTVQVGMLFVGLAIVLYGHVAKTPQQSYRTCTGFLCPTSGR